MVLMGAAWVVVAAAARNRLRRREVRRRIVNSTVERSVGGESGNISEWHEQERNLWLGTERKSIIGRGGMLLDNYV